MDSAARRAAGLAGRRGPGHALTLPLDLTAAPGITLTGPGAPDVVRALLLGILAGPVGQPPGQVVLTLADAHTLLTRPPQPHPAGLRILQHADDAIGWLSSITARRAGMDPATAHTQPLIVLVLIQPPPGPLTTELITELTALLRHGAALGVSALLGAGWPGTHGITVEDEIVTTTHGPTTSYLRGARLYHLPPAHAADLCALIAHTQPRPGT